MLYVVAILVFMILWYAMRRVNLWYWRVDERIKEQKETNRLLRKMVGEQEPPDASPTQQITEDGPVDVDEYNKRLYG